MNNAGRYWNISRVYKLLIIVSKCLDVNISAFWCLGYVYSAKVFLATYHQTFIINYASTAATFKQDNPINNLHSLVGKVCGCGAEYSTNLRKKLVLCPIL
jgi:hypothetical protein